MYFKIIKLNIFEYKLSYPSTYHLFYPFDRRSKLYSKENIISLKVQYS